MTRPTSVVLLVAGLLLTLVGPASAQTTGFAVESIELRDHPEVAVTVTLENQLIGDESLEFILSEDGEARPVSVSAAASSDLKVVLALDVSGSMRGEPLAAAQDAAALFVSQMPTGVEMAVIAFGSSPSLAAEFTDDKPTLLAAIDLLDARGETALYDGLNAAASLLTGEAEEGRTIVLLSDGGDTVSKSTLDDAVEVLEDLGADLYAIELQSPENDSGALEALAAAAGGKVIAADDPAALEALFGDVASQLLSSYRLVFTSRASGPTTLTLQVLAGGSTVAAARQTVQFPVDPTTVMPDPVTDPVPDPVPSGDRVVQPAPQPPLRSGSTIELAWLETTTASWIGVGAIFVAFAIVSTTIMLRPRGPRAGRKRSLLNYSPSDRRTAQRSPLSIIAESATALAEETLNRGDRFKALNAKLERAGVALRPGEFIVLVASGALAAGAAGFVLLNALFGITFAAIVIMLVPMRLSSKSAARSALFNEQLGDTLQLMSASMRAGYGLMQAVDAVAEEAPSPTAEEFQRIKIETHLGRDLDDSLKAAAERVDSEDFRWVAEAIEIHRQIGGDLAEILDAVNETIRDRNRIRRRIKSLSAEGRISAVILSLIPVVLVLVISLINPAYIGELPATGLGQGLIVFGIIAWLFAVAWMRRIVRLQF